MMMYVVRTIVDRKLGGVFLAVLLAVQLLAALVVHVLQHAVDLFVVCRIGAIVEWGL